MSSRFTHPMIACILALVLIISVISAQAAGHRTGELIDELAASGVYENGRYREHRGIPGEEKAATLALVADLTKEMSVMKVQLQETREELGTLRSAERNRSSQERLQDLADLDIHLETRLRFEENAWKTNLAKSVNTSRVYFRSRLNIQAEADGPVKLDLVLEDHARLGSYKPDANADGTISRPFIYRGALHFPLKLLEPAEMIVGRQSLVIGRGMFYDGTADGLALTGQFRGNHLELSAWDTRDTVLATGGGAGSNDGLNSSLFSIKRSWERATVGLFSFLQDRMDFVGYGNIRVVGGFFDLRWGQTVLAWFEGLSLRDNGYTLATRGGAVQAHENGAGIKGGVRWKVNDRVEVTASMEQRGKDYYVLEHEDDSGDSAFQNNHTLLTGYQSDGTAVRDNYSNSRILSLAVGIQALKRLWLDFWYEKLQGFENRNDLFGQGTSLTGNFDQSSVQSVVTFHYSEDASMKVRYRSMRFSDSDPDMAILAPASRPVDSQQMRLDMTVRF